MKAWTLRQLKFAEEMSFPATVETILKEYFKDDPLPMWAVYSLDIKRRGFIANIFCYSRADYDNGMGEMFDFLIEKLIGDYK